MTNKSKIELFSVFFACVYNEIIDRFLLLFVALQLNLLRFPQLITYNNEKKNILNSDSHDCIKSIHLQTQFLPQLLLITLLTSIHISFVYIIKPLLNADEGNKTHSDDQIFYIFVYVIFSTLNAIEKYKISMFTLYFYNIIYNVCNVFVYLKCIQNQLEKISKEKTNFH